MTSIIYRKPIAGDWNFHFQIHSLFGSKVGFDHKVSDFRYREVSLRFPTPSSSIIDRFRLIFGGPRKWFMKWAAYRRRDLAYYGCVKAIHFPPFVTIYIVGKKAKAIANIYLGHSFLFRGKSIGKTWKIKRHWPYFDTPVSLYLKYQNVGMVKRKGTVIAQRT